MGDADVIHAEDKDRVFPSLKSLTLIVVGWHCVYRDIPNGRVYFLPIITAWGESFQNDGVTLGHADGAVRSVLVARGDDMLGQSGLRQVKRAVGIRENSRPL